MGRSEKKQYLKEFLYFEILQADDTEETSGNISSRNEFGHYIQEIDSYSKIVQKKKLTELELNNS